MGWGEEAEFAKQMGQKACGERGPRLAGRGNAWAQGKGLEEHKCLVDFMAAVTVCSHFGAQKNKVCHCFHCFSIYLP